MKVLVTGATGHVGTHLVQRLKLRGDEVTAFVLPRQSIKAIAPYCDHILYGDIVDLMSVQIACRGIDVVFHTAGLIDISSSRKAKKQMHEVNVNGVKNVIEACKREKIKRLVYTSSVHAIQEQEKKIVIEESNVFDERFIKGSYAKTKAEATRLILQAAAKNEIDAVIVHPAGIIGPQDYSMGYMGKLIYQFLSGKLKAYTSGGYNFVDVRDVVEGMVKAQERGVNQDCFILSGEYHSVKEMITLMKEITHIKRTIVWVPKWIAYLISPIIQLYAKVRRKKPLFTAYSLNTLGSNSNFSNTKAENHLNYSHRSFKKTLEDSINWCKKEYNIPFHRKGKR